MKKTIRIWIAALAASVLSFAACSEKLDPAAQNATRTIKVTANVELEEAGSAVSTRANWTDGKGLQWEESDATKLGLIDNKSTINASTTMTIATDGTAVFTGEVNAEATKFLATYPKVNAGVNDGCSTIYFNIASAQTQAEAGAMKSADGKVAMVGKAPIDLSSEVTEYSASMRMISSLARFLVYSTEGKTDKVKSVSVTSDQAISGARVAIVNWSNEGNREFNGGDVSKTATVSLTEQFDLNGITSKDDTKGIYLGLIPATSTATTYTVTTDKGAYTFTPSAAVEFKAGTIHNIALNLDKGTFASTENEVIFTPGVTADQGVNANANKLYLGATTATCGGEAVTMNADDCVLVAIGDDGNAASWVTPFWENTNNYNLGISIEKNKTTSARAAKIYMEYKGTRSKNYINVRQDAGTGVPTIVPTLSDAYTTEIVYGGETVANAATLSLTVDGEAKGGADVDAYLSYLTISCGAATANCSNGVISIVFPENTTTSAKTYTLSVKSEDGSATLEFSQAANPGGETPSHTFSYTLFNNATDKSTGTGFGSASGSVGDWYRFENVTIDGKTYAAGTEMETLATSELGKEMLNYAFSFLELESTDVQVPGTDPLTTVAEMKEFVTLETWGSGAAIYVRIVLTQNTTGARRTFKIQTKDGSGNVLSTIVYFQNI
jgi:hypothetical protein